MNENEKQQQKVEIEKESDENNKIVKSVMERKKDDIFQADLYRENRKKALERLRQYKMVNINNKTINILFIYFDFYNFSF